MRRIPLILTALLLAACSTTKLLPPDAYRLAENKVAFSGKEKIPTGEIKPYIMQAANKSNLFGWSPAVSIYNWSNGSGEGINKFWESAGEAPVVFDSTLVVSSCENIANHLQTLGYFGSRVEPTITLKNRLARVRYTVTPGKRYPIDTLIFEVPGGRFGDAFYDDSVNISVHPGDFLAEKTLEAETVRSTSALRNRGFYDLSKNHYFFEADTLTDRTKLYYRIHEYTRNETPANAIPLRPYHIGDVRISHPANIPFRESLLRQYNTIRPGQPYSERMLDAAYSRFSSLRIFNNVSIEMTPVDTATVDCDIRLGGYGVVGLKLNLESSVNASGLFGFSPQVNFYHKNLFHGGEWLNLGFSGNWQWMMHSKAASSEYAVTAGLSFPRLLGLRVDRIRGPNIPRTEINASFNYRNRPEYRRTLASLTYGFSGQMGRNLFYQINPLQFDFVHLFALSENFLEILMRYPYIWDTFEDHIDAGVGGMLYYTTNSDVVPKTAYHYGRLQLDLSGNVISLFNNVLPYEETYRERYLLGVPYYQYIRVALDLGKVFRFGWNEGSALALHFTAGAGFAYGNSSSLPFEKQFFCGGASSMRGWQARTLGPGYEVVNPMYEIPSQTGHMKLEADIEYRFPLFWKMEGALFAETGNVWEIRQTYQDYSLDQFTLHSLAADWGLGVRVNLDFILLRLDAGFRLRDPARDAGDMWVKPRAWFKEGAMAIHFGVGYPF